MSRSLVVASLADDSRGYSSDNGVRWDIFRHDRAGADDRSVSNRDPWQHHRVGAEPDILADRYLLCGFPALPYGRPGRSYARDR